MRAWAFLLPAVCAAAQSYTLTSPAPVVPPGQPVTISLNLVSGGGPASIQFGITGLPAGGAVSTPVAGKVAQCTANGAICLVYTSPLPAPGPTVTDKGIPDGPAAVITYTQPATTPATIAVPAMGLFAASPAGAAVTEAAPAAPITVGIQSRCDLNGDGKIDSADVGLVVMNVLTGTGVFTALDLERVIIAALGGPCLR